MYTQEETIDRQVTHHHHQQHQQQGPQQQQQQPQAKDASAELIRGGRTSNTGRRNIKQTRETSISHQHHTAHHACRRIHNITLAQWPLHQQWNMVLQWTGRSTTAAVGTAADWHISQRYHTRGPDTYGECRFVRTARTTLRTGCWNGIRSHDSFFCEACAKRETYTLRVRVYR